MKRLSLFVLFVALGTSSAYARRSSYDYGSYDYGTGSNSQTEHVSGYQRKDGTYVAPYERTKANNTVDDNYGTRGNYNPYTGKTGSGPTDADNNSNTYGNNNGYNFGR